MSTNQTAYSSNENQSNSSVTYSPSKETNPSTNDPSSRLEPSTTTSTTTSNTNSNKTVEKFTNVTSQQDDEPSKKGSREDNNQIGTDNVEKSIGSISCEGEQEDSSEMKGDSFTSFATAFTISFGDESSAAKKLSIKDSIRKFAPPKPHTIEKPRQSKSDQSQNHSLISVESAPAGLSKHSSRKGRSNSSRSSSRKSNSSNISESVAFLIDKMTCQPQTTEDTSVVNEFVNKSPNKNHNYQQHCGATKRVTQPKKPANSNEDNLDSELDYYEDRSDNGTYIVGADPESEAARRNIDVLFGVVKAAEASVIAESVSRGHSYRSSVRNSRMLEKKPLDKARQEHMSRLTCRNSSISRSSSSSRPETVDYQREPRASSRRSQNSSCDRRSRVGRGIQSATIEHKRSTSQSSRQSCNNNKDWSDGDNGSSRSSLQIDADGHKSPNSTNPNMKFNRAFDLRRARHALNDSCRVGVSAVPTSIPQPPALNSGHFNSYNQEIESSKENNMSSSQRRHQINSSTYKANQTPSSSGSTNFKRGDGGRYSLRTNNVAMPTRLSANQYQSSLRSPQHNTHLDSYISKASSAKYSGNLPPSSHLCDIQSRNLQTKHTITSTTLPYQSGDELETSMPSSRFGRIIQKGARGPNNKKCHSELDADSYQSNRFNYSLGAESFDENNYQQNFTDNRACSSATKYVSGSVIQPGALDSLVISAISSLSLKIRSSVCDVLVEQAKKLPVENETRLIVEEILPELQADASSSKSPTSIEEIDQSLYFDLAKTLKNLKKVEQMVEVVTLISNQLPSVTTSMHNNSGSANFKSTNLPASGISRASDNANNHSNNTSSNDQSSA